MTLSDLSDLAIIAKHSMTRSIARSLCDSGAYCINILQADDERRSSVDTSHTHARLFCSLTKLSQPLVSSALSESMVFTDQKHVEDN